MKPTALHIERWLDGVEARIVPPERKCLQIIIDEGDDQAAAMEKAVAEHIAAHRIPPPRLAGVRIVRSAMVAA
jgi:hypothetical protein